MTRTLELQTSPFFATAFLAVAVICSVFSFSVPQARAAALTESQIQAILSLLSSFGADSKVISDTGLVLRGQATVTPTPTPVTKGTLVLSYKGKDLPAVQNVTKAIAQQMCGMLMDWRTNAYVPGSSCMWNGQAISYASDGWKENDPRIISFIKPVGGQNETIKIAGDYTFSITDRTATIATNPLGDYRVYLTKFNRNASDLPEAIYQANLFGGAVSGSAVNLKWDLGADGGKPLTIPAGDYNISAQNIVTGAWGTVSAYTFLVAVATTTTPAPCTSAPNSCGMRSPGTISMSGLCSAVTPPEHFCPSPSVELSIGYANTTNDSLGNITVPKGTAMSMWWKGINVDSCTLHPNPLNTATTTPNNNVGITASVSMLYTIICTQRSSGRSAQDSVAILVPPAGVTVPTPTTGKYQVFIDGQLAVESAAVTEAQAKESCAANVASNPIPSIRCVWNGKEIYKTPTTISTTTPAIAAPTCTVKASKTTVNVGEAFTITWTSKNADSLANKGQAPNVFNGNQQVVSDIAGPYTYTIIATGKGGEATCSATLTVKNVVGKATLTYGKGSYTTGESVTINWTYTGTPLTTDWVALVPQGVTLNENNYSNYPWAYATGVKSGSLNLTAADRAGTYQAVYYPDNTYKEAGRGAALSVRAPARTSVAPDVAMAAVAAAAVDLTSQVAAVLAAPYEILVDLFTDMFVAVGVH